MRKHCKRKVYERKNPIDLAIEGAAITPPDLLDKVRMLELGHLDALARGVGTLDGLRYLTDMVNTCQTMAEMKVGPEALPACAAAEETLLAVMRRYEKWKKLEVTASELETLQAVYQYHDLQRQSVSRGEYERALKKTGDRIRSAHPSVRVIV